MKLKESTHSQKLLKASHPSSLGAHRAPFSILMRLMLFLCLSTGSVMTPTLTLASQSGFIPKDSSALTEKCKNSILNYADSKYSRNKTQDSYFKQSTEEMLSHKSRTHPKDFSLAYPGILRDEYDFYKEQQDMKTFESSALKKEEARITQSISALNLEINQIEKNNLSRDQIKPLLIHKAELNQELAHIRERFILNSSVISDLENRIKLLDLENHFLIFASAISHHENSKIAHYVHWTKFIEPELATAKECSDHLLRKRIKDSKSFYSENKITEETQLADRILDDLTLRSFAEREKEQHFYERDSKQIQRSTASQKPDQKMLTR